MTVSGKLSEDKIEKLGNSLIQHGVFNNRIYLMKLDTADLPGIVIELDELAARNGYTKIFAKIPDSAQDILIAHGYQTEAHIPRFYYGKDDVLFCGKYFSRSRSIETNQGRIDDVLKVCNQKAEDDFENRELDENYRIEECSSSDTDEMSEIYREVFPTYPFPIQKASYLEESMDDNVRFFKVIYSDKIVALASAEMDTESRNVEMTDFATLPEHAGKSFAHFLLERMEAAMLKAGMITSYTIARAVSYSMNITFARMGYNHAGTLTNNTNISGEIESMNVWYKHLM